MMPFFTFLFFGDVRDKRNNKNNNNFFRAPQSASTSIQNLYEGGGTLELIKP